MPPHYLTLVKARLLGASAYLEKHYISHFKADLFREFGIYSNIQGWGILYKSYDRRYFEVETRGRKPLILAEDLHKMEQIIWQYGFQIRALTWQGLAIEVGIYTSARTVQRVIGTLGYRKCIACEKGFMSLSNAKKRV